MLQERLQDPRSASGKRRSCLEEGICAQVEIIGCAMRVRTDELPAILFDVIQVTCITGEGITVTCRVNTSSAKFLSFSVSQVPSVTLVKDTVGECAS